VTAMLITAGIVLGHSLLYFALWGSSGGGTGLVTNRPRMFRSGLAELALYVAGWPLFLGCTALLLYLEGWMWALGALTSSFLLRGALLSLFLRTMNSFIR
jgi:hypothetical protein